MNWEEIAKKYPKAHEKYCDWHRINFMGLTTNKNIPFKTRDLYDFFDEKKIIISLEYNDGLGAMNGIYLFNISTDESNIQSDDEFYTRTEAEEKAFTKAFEILNDKEKKERKSLIQQILRETKGY